MGGRQGAPQHPLFTRLRLCRRCAGRRASLAAACSGTTQTHRGAGRAARASQKHGTWAWSQRGRRCQPGKAEARRVPQRTQVTGEWCSRGNSGRTASARGPPPLPSPPPRPLRARVQPQGLSCLRPGAGCFSKTWVPLLQATLISCPRNAEPSAWRFLLIQSLRPLPPGRCSRHPPLRAERGAGRAGSPGARLGGAESLDGTSLQTCHTVPRLRWGCGGSRGALFLF